jgi:hypothetical protein
MGLFGIYPTRVKPLRNVSPNKPKKRSQVAPIFTNPALNYSLRYVKSYNAMRLALQEFNSLENSNLKRSKEAQNAANFIRLKISTNKPGYNRSLLVLKRYGVTK